MTRPFSPAGMPPEPPIDVDPAHLHPWLCERWLRIEAELAARGTPFRLVEGYRTALRQLWHFGKGRPEIGPERFGRPNPNTSDGKGTVTDMDGTDILSKHQGLGAPGTGLALDAIPRAARTYPPASDKVWRVLAEVGEGHGLRAGLRFMRRRNGILAPWPDAPHLEVPDSEIPLLIPTTRDGA